MEDHYLKKVHKSEAKAGDHWQQTSFSFESFHKGTPNIGCSSEVDLFAADRILNAKSANYDSHS